MSRREVDERFWQVTGDLQQLAEELSGVRPRVANARYWEPKVDLIEEQSQFLVKAELAGVKVDDIGLIYIPERHSLLIRGVRQEADLSDGCRQGAHQLEIYYGEFQREIKLPDSPIEPKSIRAQYKNGFLYVLIPKREHLVVHTVTMKHI
jgi:HSP20 family protein